MATDPRAKIYEMLESMEGDKKEQGEALLTQLKSWAEEQVRKATSAAEERNTLTDLLNATVAERDELKLKVLTPQEIESERVKALEKTVADITAQREAEVKRAEALEADKRKNNILQEYLKNTNLKQEFAELLIEKKLATGEITEQDGAIGGIVGGVFKPLAEHIKELETAHASQLKTIAGGSMPAPATTHIPQPKSRTEEVVAAVERRGGRMPVQV